MRLVACVAVGVLSLAAALVSCGEPPRPVRAAAWPEADELFRHDERWVGGDGALTIDLGNDRILWLFGDTFVSRPGRRSAENAFFIRNSVGIQTGRDPSRAFMEFFWRHDGEAAKSFLPEEGITWYWPGHGARVGDTLAMFWGRICPEGETGFQSCNGWTLVTVDHPDTTPDQWELKRLPPPPFDPGVDVGAAVVVRDGFFLAYGIKGPDHDVYLARWPEGDIPRGDLSRVEWWSDGGWSPSRADPLFENGSPEYSVHYIEKLGRWVMGESPGYGATVLAFRTAPEPQGPWSEPQPFYRPPASFDESAFVYAGKGHTDLQGADVVFTYVWGDEYIPRFVRLWFEP